MKPLPVKPGGASFVARYHAGMGTLVTECRIELTLEGDVPEWAREDAQRILDEVCDAEHPRVRKRFERALADHFGAGVLGDQSDA